MSLSNYLFQSIVFTLLFYPYGLGLAEKSGPALAMVFAVVSFGLQAFVSTVWLRSFRYGPAEWLWRSLIYKKVLAIHRCSSESLPTQIEPNRLD